MRGAPAGARPAAGVRVPPAASARMPAAWSTGSAAPAAPGLLRGRGSRRSVTLTSPGSGRLPDPERPVQLFWWGLKCPWFLDFASGRASVREAGSQSSISVRVKPDLFHGSTRGVTRPAPDGRSGRREGRPRARLRDGGGDLQRHAPADRASGLRPRGGDARADVRCSQACRPGWRIGRSSAGSRSRSSTCLPEPGRGRASPKQRPHSEPSPAGRASVNLPASLLGVPGAFPVGSAETARWPDPRNLNRVMPAEGSDDRSQPAPPSARAGAP
jgi:hypothetical protein